MTTTAILLPPAHDVVDVHQLKRCISCDQDVLAANYFIHTVRCRRESTAVTSASTTLSTATSAVLSETHSLLLSERHDKVKTRNPAEIDATTDDVIEVDAVDSADTYAPVPMRLAGEGDEPDSAMAWRLQTELDVEAAQLMATAAAIEDEERRRHMAQSLARQQHMHDNWQAMPTTEPKRLCEAMNTTRQPAANDRQLIVYENRSTSASARFLWSILGGTVTATANGALAILAGAVNVTVNAYCLYQLFSA